MNSGNENRSSEFPLKPILVGGLILLVWQAVNAIVSMITVFFSAMLTIAIIGASLVVAYLVFSFIRDRELGENKKIRKANKYEREMMQALLNSPKHLREEIKRHYREKQIALYENKSSSHVESIVSKTKQVFTLFRKGGE